MMQMKSLTIACGLFAILLVAMTGCGKGKTKAPPETAHTAGRHHHHHHGSSRGPHGGHVIGFEETEAYHAELTHDAASHRVGVHVLGEDAATVTPIDASELTIDAVIGDATAQYTLPAVSQPGETAGKTSYFELESEELTTIVSGQSGAPIGELQLKVSIGGKPHVGIIGLHDLGGSLPGHGSGGAASDDALVWLKQIKEQGYELALGHHGTQLLAGGHVEPAVQITREGQPVADAKVFNALLEGDGKTTMAEEVATVYEPPTDDEPSHYAQGSLKIPPGTRQAILRYRIVLPEGKGEHTYDLPVEVK
jgi:hypothetical protein